MEKVFFVKNDDLSVVNEELQSGGIIKYICPVAEAVSISGAGGGDTGLTDFRHIVGDVFAYIVIEY